MYVLSPVYCTCILSFDCLLIKSYQTVTGNILLCTMFIILILNDTSYMYFSSAVPEITLTSSPPPSSDGYFCPGPVQFTCVGTEIPSLTWRINNTYRGTYRFFIEDSFPQFLSLSPLLPDVNIIITSGSDSRIESTLNADVSNLRETLIECSAVTNGRIARNTTVQERQGIYCTDIIVLLPFYFYICSPSLHLLHPLFPSTPPWRSSGLPPVVPLLHLSTCCREVWCGSHP